MNEFEETYCGDPINKVSTIGDMEVYERRGYRTRRVPKYVVFGKNGKMVKESTTKRDALKWTHDNQ